MESADFLVITVMLFAVAVNRQSLVFLCAFILCELLFYSDLTSAQYSICAALCFSCMAVIFPRLSHSLSMALIFYSVVFWFSAFDCLFFPHETAFYVIFPYIIKAVDLYVIYHLLDNKGRKIGANNSPYRGAWFKRVDNL